MAVPLTELGAVLKDHQLRFLCPSCREAWIVVPFRPGLAGTMTDPDIHWSAYWTRESGTTLADLTLAPSLNFHAHKNLPKLPGGEWGDCAGWHGFVRDGKAVGV